VRFRNARKAPTAARSSFAASSSQLQDPEARRFGALPKTAPADPKHLRESRHARSNSMGRDFILETQGSKEFGLSR
jgi:hypothetical protein